METGSFLTEADYFSSVCMRTVVFVGVYIYTCRLSACGRGGLGMRLVVLAHANTWLGRHVTQSDLLMHMQPGVGTLQFQVCDIL